MGHELKQAAASLAGELEAARREGFALTPAELRRSTPLPEGQNAAPLYHEFERRMAALPSSTFELNL